MMEIKKENETALAFTFNIKALSKHAIGDANNVTWTGGWKCESNDECTAMNSICQNNLCQCPPEYIFNADMTSCIKGNIRFTETDFTAFIYRDRCERKNYILLLSASRYWIVRFVRGNGAVLGLSSQWC